MSTEGEVRLDDGRRLGFAEVGDPAGTPAFYFHGFPSSRLEAALHAEAARIAGVRLIAPDRPGYGRSTHDPGRRLADWPLDVRQLADRLAVAEFGVIGASCGGPYAIATAAALGSRVRGLALLASVAPFAEPGLTHGQLGPLRVLFWLAKRSPALVAPLLRLDAKVLLRDPERAIGRLAKLLSAPDRALLAEGDVVRARFAAALAEAYRQGVRGAAHDASLLARPWGVELRAISAAATVIQGGRDRHATPQMGAWLAAAIPAAEFRADDAAGHFSLIVRRMPEALLAATSR